MTVRACTALEWSNQLQISNDTCNKTNLIVVSKKILVVSTTFYKSIKLNKSLQYKRFQLS